jgi:beta-lactamase class A
MPLRQLCDLMITVSSNFAANLLIEKLGVENIRRTVSALGADGMQVLRGVEDQKAFDKGMNNTTTARGLVVLLDRIGHGQAVDSSADAEMIEILKRQKFNDAIPAGLPAGHQLLTRRAISRVSTTTRRSSSAPGHTCWYCWSRDRGSKKECCPDG